MKLTALDIRQKTFEKSFRGVDKDEVQAFLTGVSQEWERMGEESRTLRSQLEQAQQDVQKMREVESSLYRTLKTAEDTSAAITAQAQQEAAQQRTETQQLAERLEREARQQADQAVSAARQQARRIVDEAYQTASTTVAAMQHEVSSLGQDCQQLQQQYDALVRDLHQLATATLEKAEKARSRPQDDAAAILSRAVSVKVERPKEPAAETEPAMLVSTASTRATAAAVPATSAFERPALGRTIAEIPQPGQQNAQTDPAKNDKSATRPEHNPAAYNPKPGQQPDPDQVRSPEIERPGAPAENPGIAPAPNVQPPAPSQVPEPAAPRVEPPAPDIQPVGPSHPEISQPVPTTHPGQPGMATAPAAEKSFFDEI